MQVKVISPRGGAVGTRLVNAKTGEELSNMISRIDIAISVDDVNTARVTFGLVEVEVEARAKFFLKSPDGNMREVSSISFADGTEMDLT